jgi:hypothetical protein
MENITILKNDHVRVVRYASDIQYFDLKDEYNDFKGFTRNVRGLANATKFIEQLAKDERLKDDLTMGDITNILQKFNLNPHTYCGRD